MGSGRFVVRRGRPADAEGIREAHFRSIVELGCTRYAPEQIEAWASASTIDRALDWVARDGFFVAVAESGEIAGIALLQAEESRVGLLYVHPSYARQGVGTRLCARLVRIATEAGLSELTLESSLNAVEFYERVGFVRVEPVVRTFNGVDFECVQMRMALSDPSR